MLKFHRAAFLSAALLIAAAPMLADSYGLGRPATMKEIAAWDWNIMPDGAGMPIGSGDAIDLRKNVLRAMAILQKGWGVGRSLQVA